MKKSLDTKLAEIHANPNSKAFILADAKDADMAYGLAACGKSPEHGDGMFRSLDDYRDQMRQVVRQGLVDIMLMSVSTSEHLTIRDKLFAQSGVTPAIRANDTTEIHSPRGGAYNRQPSMPFRTALLDHAQCGRQGCRNCERCVGASLGLYSITFNNDARLDREMLEAYKAFRVEAEQRGFRHFLEVFDPNAPTHPIDPPRLGDFMNDVIARALAGVAEAGRPIFLKVVYHGPKAMEDLAHYDRHLVPGILGGSSGTTYDAFKLLDEARKHGARAALFGRKINHSEHQLSFVQFLRWIADGQVSPEEALRAYHGILQGLGLKPTRPLEEDAKLTEPSLQYLQSGGPGKKASWVVSAPASGATGRGPAGGQAIGPTKPDGTPDFAKMTPQQRLAYHSARLNRHIDGRD